VSTFASLEDWGEHDETLEHQERKDLWKCADCETDFNRKKEFEEHVLQHHLGGKTFLKPEDIQDVVSACQQVEDPTESKERSCGFCKCKITGPRETWRRHTAKHLIVLSLELMPLAGVIGGADKNVALDPKITDAEEGPLQEAMGDPWNDQRGTANRHGETMPNITSELEDSGVHNSGTQNQKQQPDPSAHTHGDRDAQAEDAAYSAEQGPWPRVDRFTAASPFDHDREPFFVVPSHDSAGVFVSEDWESNSPMPDFIASQPGLSPSSAPNRWLRDARPLQPGLSPSGAPNRWLWDAGPFDAQYHRPATPPSRGRNRKRSVENAMEPYASSSDEDEGTSLEDALSPSGAPNRWIRDAGPSQLGLSLVGAPNHEFLDYGPMQPRLSPSGAPNRWIRDARPSQPGLSLGGAPNHEFLDYGALQSGLSPSGAPNRWLSDAGPFDAQYHRPATPPSRGRERKRSVENAMEPYASSPDEDEGTSLEDAPARALLRPGGPCGAEPRIGRVLGCASGRVDLPESSS
jgi:hypothetical protein